MITLMLKPINSLLHSESKVSRKKYSTNYIDIIAIKIIKNE